LRAPPSSAEAIERSATSIATIGTAVNEVTLENARAAWARRPDPEAVRIAEGMFSEAAQVDPAATER
jgi:hypothetical protein